MDIDCILGYSAVLYSEDEIILTAALSCQPNIKLKRHSYPALSSSDNNIFDANYNTHCKWVLPFLCICHESKQKQQSWAGRVSHNALK